MVAWLEVIFISQNNFQIGIRQPFSQSVLHWDNMGLKLSLLCLEFLTQFQIKCVRDAEKRKWWSIFILVIRSMLLFLRIDFDVFNKAPF